MGNIPKNRPKKEPGTFKKYEASSTDENLRHLAFDNAAQANIIITVTTGQILIVNDAAGKLLGYSKNELITKNKAAIFDINESSFKTMLRQRTATGQATALVTAIKKNGKPFPCEITSGVFMDNDGIEKAITTIRDRSQSIVRQKNIDIKKERIVANNIVLAKSKQKEIDVKKEKTVAANIVLAKSKQKIVDTKKEKIVADNIILAQGKADARLAENNEWIKYIAKTSYDVMWDWDIASGEIYVGDSVEEVFGYKVQNNRVNFKNFIRCLLPEEKDTVEKKLLKTLASVDKSWNASFLFKRYDGSVATTTSRASIVRDEQAKAIRLIGAIHDISKLQELENKLEEQTTVQKEYSEKNFLSKLSFDVIWDWNILTNELFIGEGFEKLFGYHIKNNKGNSADWGNHLYPDDKDTVKKELHEAIASSVPYWQKAYRFIRADGSIAKVFDRATIFRDAHGKAYRMIGVMKDIGGDNAHKKAGHDLIDDNKKVLIKKIKNAVVELVYYSNEQLQTNYSEYLSKKLQYDYTYLANLFSEAEGISIQKFIIALKIERVKELIVNDELNLTELQRNFFIAA
jgi:PAS domain S-box-containing protein